MKIREGFVSNSSSSSFVINRRYVSDYQLEKIRKANEFNCRNYDIWSIYEKGDKIKFSTSMDNFDIEEYMEKIGVPIDKIKYED